MTLCRGTGGGILEDAGGNSRRKEPIGSSRWDPLCDFLFDWLVIFTRCLHLVPALGASSSGMEGGNQVGWGRLEVSGGGLAEREGWLSAD